MRVLVIDDERNMLRSLRVLIGGEHEIETAETGAEALALLEGAPFDAILCDLHLPDMNAVAFLARLSDGDAARVVFTSAGAYANGDEEFLATHRTLMKPFTPTELRRAIFSLPGDAHA